MRAQAIVGPRGRTLVTKTIMSQYVTLDSFLGELRLEQFKLQFQRSLGVRSVADLINVTEQHLAKIKLSPADQQAFIQAVHGPGGLIDRLGLHRPPRPGGAANLSRDPRNNKVAQNRVGGRPNYNVDRARSNSVHQGINPSIVVKCAEAVQKYMTPAAENAFWYLKSVDHSDAQKRLDGLPGGSFLIRLTAKSLGSFVMAYRQLGRVQNRYAKGTPNGLCFEGYDSKCFPTLEALVHYYSTNREAAIRAFKLELRLVPPRSKPAVTGSKPVATSPPPPQVRPKPAPLPAAPVPKQRSHHPGDDEVFNGFESAEHSNDVARSSSPPPIASPPVIPPRRAWFTRENDAQCKKKIGAAENGAFLVRESSLPGCYVLCVKDNGLATNYLVKNTAEGYHFAERVFDTIPEIIENFLTTPFLAESGITMKLGAPVPGCETFDIGMQRPDSMIADNFWQDWQLEHQQIEMGTRLGMGEFGEVWSGELKGTGEFDGMVAKVAIKQLKQDALADEFLKEAKVMTGLNHDNLVKIYGITLEIPRLIVSELCEHGNLKDNLMARYDDNCLCTEREFLQYAHDIAAGMCHLVEMSYVHRDLACRNVLVSASDVCKVADFGLARLVKEEIYEADRNSKMPIRWTAPESILRGTFSEKSDVFSYGVTLYEIVTHGEIPYPGMTNKEVLEAVIKRNERNAKPNGCSDEMYSVMDMTWQLKPADRPTFSNIYERLTQLLEAE